MTETIMYHTNIVIKGLPTVIFSIRKLRVPCGVMSFKKIIEIFLCTEWKAA